MRLVVANSAPQELKDLGNNLSVIIKNDTILNNYSFEINLDSWTNHFNFIVYHTETSSPLIRMQYKPRNSTFTTNINYSIANDLPKELSKKFESYFLNLGSKKKVIAYELKFKELKDACRSIEKVFKSI